MAKGGAIRVDFQNADAQGRVRLNTVAALEDLSAESIELEPGLRLRLLDGELSADGEVIWNVEEGLWVAVVDWDEVIRPPFGWSDPNYSASDVNWLHGPDVEGEAGAWKSTWTLRLAPPPPLDNDMAFGTRSTAQLRSAIAKATVSLRADKGNLVVVELTTAFHPLEPDCFPIVDDLLLALDVVLGGILEINGSPREQWRTFRARE